MKKILVALMLGLVSIVGYGETLTIHTGDAFSPNPYLDGAIAYLGWETKASLGVGEIFMINDTTARVVLNQAKDNRVFYFEVGDKVYYYYYNNVETVKGKLKVTDTGGNAHIQFSLDSTNFQNRFLLWDNDSNGTLVPGYAISGNHQGNQGNASITKDVEATFEVVTTEKHSYFYVNDSLEFVFLNVNAKEFMIGGENVAVSFYDISIVTKAGNEAEFNNVLARSEVNQYETSTDTTKIKVCSNSFNDIFYDLSSENVTYDDYGSASGYEVNAQGLPDIHYFTYRSNGRKRGLVCAS